MEKFSIMASRNASKAFQSIPLTRQHNKKKTLGWNIEQHVVDNLAYTIEKLTFAVEFSVKSFGAILKSMIPVQNSDTKFRYKAIETIP